MPASLRKGTTPGRRDTLRQQRVTNNVLLQSPHVGISTSRQWNVTTPFRALTASKIANEEDDAMEEEEGEGETEAPTEVRGQADAMQIEGEESMDNVTKAFHF